VLTGEILGQRPVQPALRLQQMGRLGIFGAVAQAVKTEVDTAAAALAEWPGEAPTPLLLGLCEVLRAQVAALQPTAA
jgi:octaprenyl-diphosphate synthase